MRSIPSVALVVALAACATNRPMSFGDVQAIAPRIDPVVKEEVPRHVQVAIARPENVAVFFVVPGRGATLLYPSDSASPTRLTAGTHLLATALARPATRDSSERAHPNTQGSPLPLPNNTRRPSAAAVMSTDSGGRVLTDGYLLVYATDEPLDYNTLLNRVTGISIPIEPDAAVSTVTKLIKGTTTGSGAWAAYSTEFVSPTSRR